MKKILLIILLSLPSVVALAQKNMDEFFAGYSGRKGYQTIVYGKRMLEMMKKDASSDVKDLLSRIKIIRIISCEQAQDEMAGLAKKAARDSKKAYEIISQINEDDACSEFYISEDTGKSKEVSFVMIASSSQGTAVMEIIGEFNVRDITKLSVIGQKK